MALATARTSTDLRTDGPPLLAAFERHGIDVDAIAWGSDADWSAYDGVVVRTTWDYIEDRDAFIGWARRVGHATRLANPPDALAWNTDKRYLRDLAGVGVPTIPTVWVESSEVEAVVPPEWDEVVVKPAISAGGRQSARYRRDELDDAQELIARIVSGSAAMVQPYVATIDEGGETGTYFFGGEASHAITKAAILRPGQRPSDDLSLGATQVVTAAPLDPALVDFGRRVLAAVPGGGDQLVYARVDTATGDDGDPMLLELELVEPFLWLETDPAGADPYVAAVARWLGL